MHELVERYRLVDVKYGRADIFSWHEELPFVSLPGLAVNLWEIFERDLAELNVVKEGPKRCRGVICEGQLWLVRYG